MHNKSLLTIILLLFCFALCQPNLSFAANWSRLNQTPYSTLWLDKTSIAKQNQHQKAWLKIQYHQNQLNTESVEEKHYNSSKSLVFFDCLTQTSATTQVFQYNNKALIYSAGVNVENAVFIEPVPESDIEIAMRAVCKISNAKERKAKAMAADKKRREALKAQQLANPKDPNEQKKLQKESKKTPPKPAKKPKTKTEVKEWSYEGAEGPNEWAKLNDTFQTCGTGLHQSPIDIKDTINAKLKRIKTIQKFTAKEISNIGHTIRMHFNKGNMMALDRTPFQLQSIDFHSPSEHTINGEQFPLAAHLVHADKDGNLAIMAVLFKEGKRNKGISKLLLEMPDKKGPAKKVKSRIKAKDFMPLRKKYYRFSGSITTPPCTEGVRWIVFKTPNTLSKKQLKAFKAIMKAPNNRPTQAQNGRIILE